MNFLIYFIIGVLYVVLGFWLWNNTKDFEDKFQKIFFITIGMLALFIVTLILFAFSKIGISYPNKEMMSKVRNITVFLFIPVNGFFSLPHIAKIKSDIILGTVENSKNQKRIIILGIINVIIAIIEIFYLKDFQNGIIQMINSK